MSNYQEQALTVIMAPIAFITGWIGLHLTEVDLLMAILLKAMSMVSVGCIIVVNWHKTILQIKKWLK